MHGDEFTQRLAGVRRRFAERLPRRLAEIDAALPRLAGEGEAAGAAVSSAHRQVHDLCGIGPTLGFVATGRAARVCERILLQPSRGERGLSEQELAHLKQGLAALRLAAENEIETTGTVPE